VEGKYTDYRNAAIDSQTEFFVDPNVTHSGRYSFRLEKKAPESFGHLNFNPVPWVAGAPVSFTVWMKADHPLRAGLALFAANGIAVWRGFEIGTEWKKYELYIPSWGTNKGDFQSCGDLVNGYAKESRLIVPHVGIEGKYQGKLWVDSASYSIGGHSTFQDKAEIHLRSSIDRNSGYCFAGEPVKVSLEAENYIASPRKCVVTPEWKDWSGKTVSTAVPSRFTLNANQKKTLQLTLTPPETLRGPVNLSFLCRSGAKQLAETTLYFGIIDRNAKPNFRVGIEFPEMQNAKLLAPLLHDFRIGCLRTGTASGHLDRSFENLPLLKKLGFKTMLCVSMSRQERDDAALRAAWLKQFESLVKRYAGNAEIYETQNEPNISGWTVDNDWKMIDSLAKIVRKYDPSAAIAGPTTCSIDYTWIGAILKKDKNHFLDIVTYHPYRPLPELPDYTSEAKRLGELIDSYGHRPQMGTEAGWCVPASLAQNKITDYVRNVAALSVRNMIQGFAGGVARYYHFALYATNYGNTWNVVFMGNPANGNTPVPNVSLFAIRNLIDRLEDAPVSGRAKLGLNYRCPIFDHGDRRTAVLWKWQGEPSVMKFAPSAAAKLTGYDFCGSRIDPASFTLNEFPIYLDSALSTTELAKLIENAEMANRSGKTLEVEPVILSDRAFALKISNTTGRPVGCRVTLLTPDVAEGATVRELKSIPGEDSALAKFELKDPVSTVPRKLKFRVEIPGRSEKQEQTVILRGILAHKTPNALKIDGDLSDWPKTAEPILLDRRNTDPREHRNWGDKENRVTAKLRYAWDDDHLYVAVEVFKPDFHPLPDAAQADRVWKYDSIQVDFDPLHNAAPQRQGLEDDDFEYSIGLMGGVPRVYRRWSSSALYDSLDKTQGLLPPEEVPAAVKQYPDRTVYEVAFPRRAVSPFRLQQGNQMRIGTLVNLNNGKERTGYLELTPGIGHEKRPGQWMDLVLLP